MISFPFCLENIFSKIINSLQLVHIHYPIFVDKCEYIDTHTCDLTQSFTIAIILQFTYQYKLLVNNQETLY